MLFKVYKASRIVVALCDEELIGKKFLDEKRQLDLTGSFFRGEKKDVKEIEELLVFYKKEDACFNIVGKKSCDVAIKVGLVKKEDLAFIEGVPFVLVLM